MITRPSLLVLLAVNAGFVDTVGFLTLQGLFTAHVTGNFVTIAASLLTGHTGLVAKLAALPVFLVVVACCAMLAERWRLHGTGMRNLLLLQLVLLLITALLAMSFGPFADADRPMAIATGLFGVAAMAVQNAEGRIYLGHLPPTTLMTGNSTQIALDLVGLGQGSHNVSFEKLRNLMMGAGAFAMGGMLAALAVAQLRMGAFLLPPILVTAAAFHPQARPAPTVSAGP